MSQSDSKFGKVAVLMGGHSAEREVSLMSGTGVLQALRSRGVDAQPFDPAERDLGDLRRDGFRSKQQAHAVTPSVGSKKRGPAGPVRKHHGTGGMRPVTPNGLGPDHQPFPGAQSPLQGSVMKVQSQPLRGASVVEVDASVVSVVQPLRGAPPDTRENSAGSSSTGPRAAGVWPARGSS